jgi:benzaldehyde dehydrogenase (NAD)
MALLEADRWTGQVFVDGWEPGGGGDYAVVEPATGNELGRLGAASVEDVARAAPRVRGPAGVGRHDVPRASRHPAQGG